MVLVLTRKWHPDFDPYHIGYAAVHTRNDTGIVAEMTKRGNIIADPGLVEPARGDFHLKGNSPAWRAGFQKIPVEEIGVKVDEFRKSVEK